MTDNIVNLWDARDTPEMDMESAEAAKMAQFRDDTFQFEAAIHKEISVLRDVCQGHTLPIKDRNGGIILVPFLDFVDALEVLLLRGMMALKLTEDPEHGTVAEIIRLPVSRKPKRPRVKTTKATPSAVPLSEEELSKRKVVLEARKAERAAERTAKLDALRMEYGEAQAQVYAELMGWS